MIGLFRRESTTSGSVAGSDPCLAEQLANELQATQSRSAAKTAAIAARQAGERRSVSICGVTPIAESSENGVDPLGALIELENTGQYPRFGGIHSRTNRRRSLLDLNG